MLNKLKANLLFHKLLNRPNIDKAYAMVPPTDSWYDTITRVHQSVTRLQALPHETVKIQSHDGLTLSGLYFPCDNARATVIWIHGYSSHALREGAFPGLFYHNLGYNVLIPYQRAHGPSEGNHLTFGAYEHQDMLLWIKEMNRLNLPIVLHGLSMGGGIVLHLSDEPMENVRCLIADAPTPDIVSCFHDIACQAFGKSGEKVLSHLLTRYKKEFGVDPAAYDGIRRASGCRYPLFLTAGSEEHLEERLAKIQAANPNETQTLILPGCNHGNGMYKQTELFQSTLKDFLSKHMNAR